MDKIFFVNLGNFQNALISIPWADLDIEPIIYRRQAGLKEARPKVIIARITTLQKRGYIYDLLPRWNDAAFIFIKPVGKRIRKALANKAAAVFHAPFDVMDLVEEVLKHAGSLKEQSNG
jgi:hypothetical protein